MTSLNLVLLGAPGAGKGTQAELLVRDLSLVHLSTGNLLREAVESGTGLGREAAAFMDQGQLVPDQVIIGLVREFMQEHRGCLLDGFPRTLPQAEALTELFQELELELNHVIEVRTDPELIVSRLQQRLVCTACGAPYNLKSKPPKAEGRCDLCQGSVERRQDDEPETIRKRLAVYQAQTAPLVDYYQEKGILLTVDGDLTPEGTYAQIQAALGVDSQ